MTTSSSAQLQRWLRDLDESGRRVTPQRETVCRALLEHGGHPTPQKVYERVREINPAISQATVYNTISVLEELQLIRKLDIAHDEHAHYDVDMRPHVNVVCTNCHRVVDVHTDTLEALLALVATRAGYALAEDGVLMYGLCPQCRRGVSP